MRTTVSFLPSNVRHNLRDVPYAHRLKLATMCVSVECFYVVKMYQL
jgi:hypothetical protein